MYSKIFAGLDGSHWSNLAANAALNIAEKSKDSQLIGCHVYAAELHRTRFEEMEPGLPDQYQEEERLNHLRDTHESLITDGLELISDSYLSEMVRLAQGKGIQVGGITPEGRNYSVMLKELKKIQPDLVVLGANGHGYVPESQMGSLCERILINHPSSDLLVLRQTWDFKGKPIVVGIDGSQNSYYSLSKALELARMFNTHVEAIAVYDPFFHGSVFKVIAEALPIEQQQRFNFPAQEKLHDEIIDRGLEKLYREGLERASLLATQQGIQLKTEVLAGKVYSQIHHYAQLHNAGLVVLGRWGLHQDPLSLIGSNTHQFARLASTNTLIVTEPDHPIEVPEIQRHQEAELTWTPAAEERLHRIPFFARGMARRSIEEKAREQGKSIVDEDFMKSIGNLMGKR
ncbi:MAG: universal stress protein [Anaerolineaceae bacterium]